MSSIPINNTIGKSFIELLSVDSTNNYAMRQVQQGAAKGGEAYFAYEQTAGKGQFNKTWLTAKGENIILSVVIDTSALSLEKMFYLNMATALSAQQLFNNYTTEKAKIKWPNDIYWNDRKAAGILIENIIRGKSWQFAIIGLGMNINQNVFDAGLSNPVSLKQVTGKTFDVVALAKTFCEILDENLGCLMLYDGDSVIERNYNSELYRLNQESFFKTNEKIFQGIVRRVDGVGQLIIEVDGIEKKFTTGSVEWMIGY